MTLSSDTNRDEEKSFAEKADEYTGNCPHLGLLNDPQTCYRSASPKNYCHYVKDVSAIDLLHQTEFCIGAYQRCPLLNEQLDVLPSLDRGSIKSLPSISPRNLRVILMGVGAVLFIVASFFIFFRGNSPSLINLVKTEESPGIVGTAVIPQDEKTIIPTTTPNEVHTLTPNPVLTATETAEPQSQIPTPLGVYHGVQMGIPMGAEDRYVVHRVAPNESLNLILEAYQSSQEAFNLVNQSQNSNGLWVGDVLVVPHNKFDTTDLLPLTAIYIDSFTFVSDLCGENTIEETLFREINDLDEELKVLGPGQWVLIPFTSEIGVRRSVTPTPIFDDGTYSQVIGQQGEFLLHQVTFEDTLNEVSIQNNTTAAVLSKLNNLPEDYVLNLGQILLIQPNVSDIAYVRSFSVIRVFKPISIENICSSFGLHAEVLMVYNGLAAEDGELVENRWLIYPNDL